MTARGKKQRIRRGKEGETEKELLKFCIEPKTNDELKTWYKDRFNCEYMKGLNRILRNATNEANYKQANNDFIKELKESPSKTKKEAKRKIDKNFENLMKMNILAPLWKIQDGKITKYKTKIDHMVRKYPETILCLDKETIEKNSLFVCPKPTLISFLLKNPCSRITIHKSSYFGNVKDLEKNSAVVGSAVKDFLAMSKEKEGVKVSIIFDGEVVCSQLFKNEYMIHALNSNKDFKKMKLYTVNKECPKNV